MTKRGLWRTAVCMMWLLGGCMAGATDEDSAENGSLVAPGIGDGESGTARPSGGGAGAGGATSTAPITTTPPAAPVPAMGGAASGPGDFGSGSAAPSDS